MTLDARPEIDALIARKIMFWDLNTEDEWIVRDISPVSIRTYRRCDWSPSANIAHAWEVVEKMLSVHRKSVRLHAICGARGIRWCCLVTDGLMPWGIDIHGLFKGERMVFSDDNPTAPLAICRAALESTRRTATRGRQ